LDLKRSGGDRACPDVRRFTGRSAGKRSFRSERARIRTISDLGLRAAQPSFGVTEESGRKVEEWFHCGWGWWC
jgi:hypothetical protein